MDGIYRAADRMKIEGRKRKFVQIDGAPQKEERQSSKEMQSSRKCKRKTELERDAIKQDGQEL